MKTPMTCNSSAAGNEVESTGLTKVVFHSAKTTKGRTMLQNLPKIHIILQTAYLAPLLNQDIKLHLNIFTHPHVVPKLYDLFLM